MDNVAVAISKCGRGALLGKIDIQSAFRIIPVHPEDRRLLGMLWKDMVYIDTTLPFGLRSAPKLFNSLADALQWIMKKKGVHWVAHYLDDFIFIGPPTSPICGKSLQTALEVCAETGTPVAYHKVEGPSTCLIILGIEVDTVAMELRLPPEKLSRLKNLIREWRQRKACTLHDLQSLIGHLCHAAKVVHPGRRFLREMFNLLSHGKKKWHRLRLTAGFRADLEWWHTFLSDWNGVSMMTQPDLHSPDIQIFSDASGS